MKKIVFACNSSIVGGSEYLLVSLAEGVQKRGMEVRLLLHSGGSSGEYGDLLSSRGLAWDEVNTAPPETRKSFEIYHHAVSRYLQKTAPDLVHIAVPYFRAPQVYAAAAAGSMGIPYLFNFQSVSPMESRCLTAPWLVRFFDDAGALVCVSEGNRRRFDALFPAEAPRRMSVIHNSIDVAAMQKVPAGGVQQIRKAMGFEGRTVLVTTARLAEGKGHADVIGAAGMILKRHPSALFAWIGDGPLRDSLSSQIERLGWRDHFRLLGHRPDVRDILAASDVFVFPSHFEGFSLSLVEAMAAGLPIVATRADGVEEAIRDGESGLVVDSHAPDQLARAMIRMLDDPSFRQKCGADARAGAGRFDLGFMVGRYLDLYASLA